jgi:2-oxoglutarate dehydrogenase complex dehydrogenase (E1) component-like enzyme
MEDDFEFDGQDGDIPSREELAVWLSEFMTHTAEAETMYRAHFCDLVTNRVYDEFGYEGLCEMLMSIDKRGHWISDILIENNDIDDILFKKYGVFDTDAIKKARTTSAMAEMNQTIWKLRRKYAKQIADELMGITSASEGE